MTSPMQVDIVSDTYAAGLKIIWIRFLPGLFNDGRASECSWMGRGWTVIPA